VYAMNSLLMMKGVYSGEEFEEHFVEWAEKEVRRAQRPGARRQRRRER
jgi:hypothetical protein